MSKEFLSGLAIALTLIAYFPYIRAIHKGEVKPHVFSWVIWGTTTCIVFFAQLADNGGAGAWPTAVSGIITVYVAVLAFAKKSDRTITGMDWLFFITALSALPFWYFSQSPLAAVIILTTIDTLGFAPTIRKAWHFPYEEQLTFFALMTLKYIISIFALQHYSLTTMLFPLTIVITSIMFIVMVLYRRQVRSS